MILRSVALAACLTCTALGAAAKHPAPTAHRPHNVLIFVADGLRYDSVTEKSAPTLWRLRHDGVDFTNSHSLYPTLTTVNASAIATGHDIGDTGDFGNRIWSGSAILQFEDDTQLGQANAQFGGNYLNETSLLAAARAAGFATAAMGKVGPTAIQDVTQRDGTGTIVIDDEFGIAIAPDLTDAIKAAGLVTPAPKPNVPNVEQQQYMAQLATKVVLPRLAASGKSFAMLYWSRDPDLSQHLEKDGSVNGPTGQAGIKDADDTLAALLGWLKAKGLDKTTDVFVTADHGFSTIDKHSGAGELPADFLAKDLKAFPAARVVANGGSDLIYLGEKKDAAAVVDALTKLDYVSGIFADDALGDLAGSLPMSAINWRGAALTPQPSIVVSFASHLVADCKPTLLCAAEVADTSLATGQGMHGTFSRADTRNFMAAIGPDFKARFADPAPIANSDIAPTLAHVLGLAIAPRGKLPGRPILESLKGGKAVSSVPERRESAPAANGLKTVLEGQRVGDTRYFDAAGFPGRTVGLGGP
jgi:arylsulfatase A-like enzyme